MRAYVTRGLSVGAPEAVRSITNACGRFAAWCASGEPAVTNLQSQGTCGGSPVKLVVKDTAHRFSRRGSEGDRVFDER